MTLTVVIPGYNEAATIAETVTRWGAVIAAIPGARILVVDDASTDDMPAQLAAAAARDPRLIVMRQQRNQGHGPALRAGLLAAEGAWLFHSDADLEIAPEEFPRFWAAKDRHDMVVGYRERRADGALRLVISRSLRAILRLVAGVQVRDANCPAKLMRAALVRDLLARVPADAFIPMVHLMTLARRDQLRIAEIAVAHHPRGGGRATIRGIAKWARVGWRCLGEIARLRRRA